MSSTWAAAVDVPVARTSADVSPALEGEPRRTVSHADLAACSPFRQDHFAHEEQHQPDREACNEEDSDHCEVVHRTMERAPTAQEQCRQHSAEHDREVNG